MKRSLVGTSTCRVWRRISLGCAQELGESTEKSSSHLAQAEPLSPAHSLMWLILLSPNCLSLFTSADTKTTPTAAPQPWQGRPVPPEALLVVSPLLVTLLGFSFGICASPALPTGAPGIPPHPGSGNPVWWPPPWPLPPSPLPPQATIVQQELKSTRCFLPQAPALPDGLFPYSKGIFKGEEWGIAAKADNREVMLVSDKLILQGEDSSWSSPAFFGLSWLFVSLPCSLTAVPTRRLGQI